MFLDDTACNLASLNLLQFKDKATKRINIADYEHAVRLWTVVLEVSVMMAQFPSKRIAELSYEYRTLGLGYANIGGLLMSSGIPYDSAEARAIAGSLTAIMMAFCLAFILRGNMIAAALGTAFGNPLTFPLIFAVAYRIGVFLLGRAPERVGEANLFTLLRHLDFAPLWHPILKPVLIGGLPLAALCGAVFYVLTWQGVRLFQLRGKRRTL